MDEHLGFEELLEKFAVSTSAISSNLVDNVLRLHIEELLVDFLGEVGVLEEDLPGKVG